MKKWAILTLILSIAATPMAATAQSASQPSPPPPTYDMTALYQQVSQLVRRHYPAATSSHLDSKIHFEFNTRVYTVHGGLMTGDWSAPYQERGPARDDVECDIQLSNGKPPADQRLLMDGEQYLNDDLRYFKRFWFRTYAPGLDANALVNIKFPRNPPQPFMKELNALMNDLDKYVVKTRPASLALAKMEYKPVSPAFQLVIEPSAPFYRPGAPITVTTRFKNVSDNLLEICASYPTADYLIEVKDDKGALCRPTLYGQRRNGNNSTHFGIGPLEIPGKHEIVNTFLVNRFFDMSEDGDYFVKFTRSKIPATEKPAFGIVESNVLKITVRESPAGPTSDIVKSPAETTRRDP